MNKLDRRLYNIFIGFKRLRYLYLVNILYSALFCALSNPLCFCAELPSTHMRWRPLAVNEDFIYSGHDSVGGGREGYAVSLRLKNHRHCKCLKSIPVLYVAEHHPSLGPWPVHYTASNYSAQQFLLNNPLLEIWLPELFLARIQDVDLIDRVIVQYGFIVSSGRQDARYEQL